MDSAVLTPPVVSAEPRTDPTADAVHLLARGTELLGEYEDSGYHTPKFLVRRADGQVMQLPLLLYRLAGSLDGRTAGAVAASLSDELGEDLTAENVVFLVEERLRPVGIIEDPPSAPQEDPESGVRQAAPKPVRSDPLLALRYRVGLVPAAVVGRIADVFRPLFLRPVWITALALFVGLDVWILVRGDLLDQVTAGAVSLIHQPALILAILGVGVLSSLFHECGHVAACRYGGARPGDMGVGLYLVWPAFYSTVTDSYRLNRVGRLRTDLGGIYFNVIFIAGVSAVYLATGAPWLLLAIITMVAETAYQFLPSLRLDGYYILADLVGVPDLFLYIGPVLSGVLPGRSTHPRVRELRPWTRRVMVLWVCVTIPFLLLGLAVFLLVAPRVVPLLWPAVLEYADTLDAAVRSGDLLTSTLGVFQLFFLVLPWIGSALLLWMLGSMFGRAAVARWGRRLPAAAWSRIRRGAVLTVLAGLGTGLVARVAAVAGTLPPSPGELRLTDTAVAAAHGLPPTTDLSPGEYLAGQQVLGHLRLTGALDRHATAVTAARELAVVATVVLVGCLLGLVVQGRLRPLAAGLALATALTMGPAVALLATVGPGLIGSAWAAVGVLVLLRGRRRPAVVLGTLALLVGLATEPLLAVVLAVAAAAVLARRGRAAADRGPAPFGLLTAKDSAPSHGRHRLEPSGPDADRLGRYEPLLIPVLLLLAVGFAAMLASERGDLSLPAPDRTLLVVLVALVVLGGLSVRATRPAAAAAACVGALALAPWSGAGSALVLALLTALLLGSLLVDSVVRQPVTERPHPLLRSAVAVPVLVVVVVGGLFLPPRTPALPHAALAGWLAEPAHSTSEVTSGASGVTVRWSPRAAGTTLSGQ